MEGFEGNILIYVPSHNDCDENVIVSIIITEFALRRCNEAMNVKITNELLSEDWGTRLADFKYSDEIYKCFEQNIVNVWTTRRAMSDIVPASTNFAQYKHNLEHVLVSAQNFNAVEARIY